jgi:predicted Fe-Mo cluster-binding NifX family protein
MKILVTAKGKTLDAPIDPRFGRAEVFLVLDTDSQALEAVDNRAGREAAQGAGILAAEQAVTLGAEVVLTGHCGPNSFRALTAAGVKVFSGLSGTAREAVESFQAGRLTPTAAPDVKGHWA